MGMFGPSEQEKANKAAAEEAVKNRDFQLYMSNSAHQREVVDLKKAGLNPLLSGTGGSGASTPSGSIAPVIPTDPMQRINQVQAISESAMKVAGFMKDMKQKDAQTNLTNAQEYLARSSALERQASAQSTMAELPSVQAKAVSAPAQADLDKATAEFNKKAVTYDGVVNRIIQGFGGIFSAMRMGAVMQGMRNDSRNQTMREETHLRNQGIHGTELQ